MIFKLLIAQSKFHRFCSSDLRAKLVRDLRRKTGAGISLCMEALGKTGNDLYEAMNYVNEHYKSNEHVDTTVGLKPGLVGILTNGGMSSCIISKLSCQTDIVAKTDVFLDTYKLVIKALNDNYIKNFEREPLMKYSLEYEDFKNVVAEQESNMTINDTLKALAFKVHENVSLEDIIAIRVPEGYHLGYYAHSPQANTKKIDDYQFQYGRIGGVAIISACNVPFKQNHVEYNRLAKSLALHIVGMLPKNLGNFQNEIFSGEINEKDNELTEESLSEQPFFTQPSINVKNWALSNSLKVYDYILVE